MKKLNFIYKVRYSFSVPVTDHCYALRILPETNEEQGIYASEYQISGGNSYVSGHIVPGHDGFGNGLITGRLTDPHDCFSFCVTGTAYTRREGLRRFEQRYQPMYRYPTDLTRPGESIRAFWLANRDEVHEYGRRHTGGSVSPEHARAGSEFPEYAHAGSEFPEHAHAGSEFPEYAHAGSDSLERALAWMDLLSREISYAPGTTGIRTKAEDAFAGGYGVCQDYAHILISLLRLDGIPARYVAGLMIGEGATHAWCEAWCEGVWVGLDPTHNRMLTDDYIEVAHGRDYRDCIMDRGIFRGFALQEQEVYVKVSESETPSVGRLNIL